LSRNHPVVGLELLQEGLVDLALRGIGEPRRFVGRDGRGVNALRRPAGRSSRIRTSDVRLLSMVSSVDLSVAVATLDGLSSGRQFEYLARRVRERRWPPV
jgi:hypothetical protein